MSEVKITQPVTLSIDYPDRELDKFSTFFRPFMAIPILIILGLLGGAPFAWEQGPWRWEWPGFPALVVAPTALMIIFRQKYPRWWYDWNLNLARFTTRVIAYAFLLITDQYPPFNLGRCGLKRQSGVLLHSYCGY